jgi:hypothetical protein
MVLLVNRMMVLYGYLAFGAHILYNLTRVGGRRSGSDSPLYDLENVILSPHVAGFTLCYDERASDLFAENLPLFDRRATTEFGGQGAGILREPSWNLLSEAGHCAII